MLKKLGFLAINTVLANTMEVMLKAPQTTKKKSDTDEITAIVEKVINKEIQQLRTEFKTEMVQLRKEIIAEAK